MPQDNVGLPPSPRALISVSDKTGIIEFAGRLTILGWDIISTGGTAKVLREAGIHPVIDVSEITGFPEIMDGRVKTLHPAVHGGLLAKRDNPKHMATIAGHSIAPIDLVAVNLYPFSVTAAKPNIRHDEVIEQIDIGGPSMLRSAAKNAEDVWVVVDPADYTMVLEVIRTNGDPSLRRRLAAKVFRHTSGYDAAIADWHEEKFGKAEA